MKIILLVTVLLIGVVILGALILAINSTIWFKDALKEAEKIKSRKYLNIK